MKIAWITNSTTQETGFGQQAKLVATELQNRGHENIIICRPHTKQETDFTEIHVEEYIWPKIETELATIRPDAVIVFDGHWLQFSFMDCRYTPSNCPMFFWFPFEGSAVPISFKDGFNGVPDNSIVHLTEYSKKLWGNRGNVIGHCCDPAYKPLEADVVKLRQKWAKKLKLPILHDSLLLININRNFFHKGWDHLFHLVSQLKDDANIQLLCHTSKTWPEDRGGFDLPVLSKMYGIEDEVMFTDCKFTHEEMNELYNMSTVRVDMSHGEGFGLCLSPDSLIVTESGTKLLSSVEKSDHVLTHQGIFREVLDTTKRKESVLYEVYPQYRQSVKVTKEHPFLILDKNGYMKWVNVCALDPKFDRLAVIKPLGDKSLPIELDLSKYVDSCMKDENHIWHKMGFSSSRRDWSYTNIQTRYGVSKKIAEGARKIISGQESQGSEAVLDLVGKLVRDGFDAPSPVKTNRFVKIDDDFLLFSGWFLAEGSTVGGKQSVEFSLNYKELSVAEWLQSYVKKSFGLESIILRCDDKKVIRLVISGNLLAQFMSSLFGMGAANKKIPPEFLGRELRLLPLVEGYVKGDGHISLNHNRVSFTTKSKHLIYQITNILACNGVLGSVSHSKSRDIYTFRVVSEHLGKVSCFLNLPDNFRRNRSRQHRPSFQETDRYFFVPIKRIEKVHNEFDYVCDLSIDGSKSFIANGVIVHNTCLEAAKAGCPQVMSDHTTMPEVVGDSAILVPPTSKYYRMGTLWDIPDVNKMAEIVAKNEFPRVDYSNPDFEISAIADKWEETLKKEYNGWKDYRFGYHGSIKIKATMQSAARLCKIMKWSALELGSYDGEFVDWCLKFGVKCFGLEVPENKGDIPERPATVIRVIPKYHNPWPEGASCLVLNNVHSILGDPDAGAVSEILGRIQEYEHVMFLTNSPFKWGMPRFNMDQLREYLKAAGLEHHGELRSKARKKLPSFEHEIWSVDKTVPKELK